MSGLLTNKWFLIVSGIIIIALIIFFFGKKRGTTIIKPVPLPIVGINDVTDNTESERIRRMTLALFEDMDGFNYIGHNMDLFSELLTSSDSFLVNVYNDFNQMYIALEKGTLTKWIENEMFADSVTTDALLERMYSLNLM